MLRPESKPSRRLHFLEVPVEMPTNRGSSAKRTLDDVQQDSPPVLSAVGATVVKHAKVSEPRAWRVGISSPSSAADGSATTSLTPFKSEAATAEHAESAGDPPSTSSEPKSPANLAVFLTKVHDVDRSFAFNDSKVALGAKDILRYQHNGPLVKSAQFNYTVHINWTIQQYAPADRSKPLTVVLGLPHNVQERQEKRAEAGQFKNVQLTFISLPMSYGTHHTKMMLLKYERGMRIVIHTANMIAYDWFQKTQGVWISPFFPLLSDEEIATNLSKLTDYKDSVTQFKRDMIAYLSHYKDKYVLEWIEEIRRHDLSKTTAFLLASVPGRFTGADKQKWGHLRLAAILEQHASAELRKSTNSSAIIGQFSSIGSLGKEPTSWVCSEFFSSLRRPTPTLSVSNLALVFPTVENVRTSLEGYDGGGCLPYTYAKHKDQAWLQRLLHKWKSDTNNRTQVIPHIKTYTRLTEDMAHVYWYLVTSANLSKAAWGCLEKNGAQLMIRSYELGVLLMPNIYGLNSFKICNSIFTMPTTSADDDGGEITCLSSDAEKKNHIKPVGAVQEYVLRLPYDVPVEPYESNDRPWCGDLKYTKLDTHGEQY